MPAELINLYLKTREREQIFRGGVPVSLGIDEEERYEKMNEFGEEMNEIEIEDKFDEEDDDI